MWTFPALESYTVFLFGVTFFLSYAMVKQFSKRVSHEKARPKCLPSLPFIGSLLFVPPNFVNLPKFFMETAEKLGPIFAFYSGNRYTVVLNGRESLEAALVRRALDFADRNIPTFDRTYLNISMKGLVDVHYTEEYKKTRRTVLSVLKNFGFGARQVTETKIHQEAEVLMEKLRTFQGVAFNPTEVLGASVSNVLLSIIFGHRFDDPELIRLNHDIRSFMHNMPMLPEVIPLSRYFPTIQKKISNMSKAQHSLFEILNAKIKNSVASVTEEDFVKRYMEAVGEDYDHEDLLYIIRDLMVAGSDTTETSLLWAMIMLANNPKVQSSIRDEINSVVPRTRLPSLDDKPNLPYTEASMAELMRWRTLAPLAVPRMTLNDTEVDGLFIPKGTPVILNLYSAHMDPEVWSEPEKFHPERFLGDDGKFQGGNRVISFSLGKRSCLGEVLARPMLFLLISAILQNFEILPPEGQQLIDESGTCETVFVPHPFQIRVIPWKL